MRIDKQMVRRLALPAGMVLLVGAAFLVGRAGGQAPAPTAGGAAVAAEGKKTVWSCSMDPQVRQPGPGKCPICGMDLIPVTDDGDDDQGEVPQLKVSPRAVALMQVQTSPVQRRYAEHEVRLFGRVDYDETRLHDIVVRAEGEIRRLFLNFANAPVRKGDHLAEIYSPQVLQASEELLIAVRSGAGKSMIASSQRKLGLLGVSERQISKVVETGKVTDTFTVHSPVDGMVAELRARQGNWLARGGTIARVADLSQVWVLLEAYESDLPWLRYGQKAAIVVDAWPAEVFEGTVAFIDPVVDQGRRTARVRVTLQNADRRLKPGMFARGRVASAIGAGGAAVDPSLAGKWVSPMHPEIVKDKPGSCDVCGMKLERAETLGLTGEGEEAPLVIPASAPLLTGRRALVYVQLPRTERPTYEPREVVLGPRTGAFYVVRQGLTEGEQVVVHGAFRIDSELQIRGRPSMMSPKEASVEPAPVGLLPQVPGPLPAAFAEQVGAVATAYFAVATSLAQDAVVGPAQLRPLQAAVEAVDPKVLQGAGREAWARAKLGLQASLEQLGASAELEAQREAFEPLSSWLEAAVRTFGAGGTTVYPAHCPMAFDNRGANWLQQGPGVENPYFGSKMFRCGRTGEPLAAQN